MVIWTFYQCPSLPCPLLLDLADTGAGLPPGATGCRAFIRFCSRSQRFPVACPVRMVGVEPCAGEPSWWMLWFCDMFCWYLTHYITVNCSRLDVNEVQKCKPSISFCDVGLRFEWLCIQWELDGANTMALWKMPLLLHGLIYVRRELKRAIYNVWPANASNNLVMS